MDTEAIKTKIIEDKNRITNSYRRYPVRFLFMELSADTQKEIEDIVKSFNGELLELGDFIMKKDDGWMTKNRFIQVVKNNVSQTKDTFIVGFSELIRFFSKKEIESTVLSLFDIENPSGNDFDCSQRRIYFICFSMMDNVYKVLQNSFPRKDLIDPFINADYELSGAYREVCFVSSNYASSIKSNKITSSVEWLGLWKNSEIIDFRYPIWCCSENLYQWHQKASPDNAFQIAVVSNTKEYIEKTYGIGINTTYSEEDERYWIKINEAIAGCEKIRDFKDIVARILSVNLDSLPEVAGKYFVSESTFEKWIIRKYVADSIPDSFLGCVFTKTKSESKKEFLNNIWQLGYATDNASYLSERLNIIKELNKYSGFTTPEDIIQNAISDSVASSFDATCINNDNSQIDLLLTKLVSESPNSSEIQSRLLNYYARIFKPAYTGLSNVEKEFLIILYSCAIIDRNEIKNVYPSLFSYLYGDAEKKVQAKEEYKLYLQSYRESKIHNKDNPYLDKFYQDGCANSTNLFSMYYDLERQESIVMRYIDENTSVYVLDGVGAEYIPLLVDLIRKCGYSVTACEYATCHLPSITEINKDYLKVIPYKEWFVDFDQEVIHGEFYKSNRNLRKAFDILETKIREIISESPGRIIITADHGATARAKWCDTKKKYDFSNADHEGRCCRITSKDDYSDTCDYIVYEDEERKGKPYLISLNETSLYNRPKYEDHGGATMEEMLVPVIVADITGDISAKTVYRVLDEKTEVSGLDKNVAFYISPDPSDAASLIETDGSAHLLKKEGEFYTTELSSGREQEITIVIGEQEFKFKIKKKSKNNMQGDDGFDD